MTINPQRAQSLFLAALELSEPAARQQLLDRECAGDLSLRQRVEALLRAHDAAGGFGDDPSGPTFAATIEQSSTARPGTTLSGRYKLLEAIGEGGMGTVWVAEQIQPVRRKVAVKLVKAGMDSRQVLARFEAERQALALMDHQNIAKVFDGGLTDQGRPYFAMEYVKGVPLTDYCNQAKLSLKQRLQLFIPVCQAVQHAHQKGIIHRDLKPSNILICLYDGKPVPKVIDFGLAKAMHQSLTEHTLHTAHGMMVGTPLYMSPEQAEYNNLDVDTRSDVYSLGVILYELLSGSTPLERHQFKEGAINEVLRLIKEFDATHYTTTMVQLADHLGDAYIRAGRKENAQSLLLAFHRKNAHSPAANYSTLPGEVLSDVAQSLARRNFLKERARVLEKHGLRNESLADYESAITEQRQLRERGGDLAIHQRYMVPLIFQYGTALLRAGKNEAAEAQLDEAIRIAEELAQNPTRPPVDVQLLVQAYVDRAIAYLRSGKKELADRMFANSIASGKGVPAAIPLLTTVARHYAFEKKTNEAIALLEQLRIEHRSLSPEHPNSLEVLQGLVDIYRDVGRIDEATSLHEEVLERRIKYLGDDHQLTLDARAKRATLYTIAGRIAEALAEIEQLTKSSNWQASQLYDFACVYSLASSKFADRKQEYGDRAMKLLQQAGKAIKKYAAQIAKDPVFAPLRDREDFKKLLELLQTPAA